MGAFAVGGDEKLSTGRGRHGRGEMTSKMRGGRSRISVTRRRRAFIRNHFSSQILSPSLPPLPRPQTALGVGDLGYGVCKKHFWPFWPWHFKKKGRSFMCIFRLFFARSGNLNTYSSEKRGMSPPPLEGDPSVRSRFIVPLHLPPLCPLRWRGGGRKMFNLEFYL